MVVLNYIVHLLTKFVFSFPQATAYIFTDMQTKDRHAHAMECYYVTARRCGALLQWISQVCCSFIVLTVCVPEILKIFSTLKSKIGSLVSFYM